MSQVVWVSLSVHITPEKFETGDFTLETHQTFSVHTTPEKIRQSLWICVWGKPTHGNHVIIVTSSFSKSSVFKMFSVHTKTKNKRFQIPAVRKAFPKSPDFRDGLVWKAGITVEINLRFIFCVGSWNRVSKITNLAGVFTPTTLTKSVPNDCSLF